MPIDCPESNRYQSSFMASKESEISPAIIPCSRDCGERGHCDPLSGECVCDKGWSGEGCTYFEDPCSSPLAVCGENGVCEGNSDGTYQCRCAEGWTGSSCNVPTQCLPNGLWIASSRKCSCFEGWEGPSCTQCNPDFLCVPTENRDRPFALTYVPKDVQNSFLKGDLGSKYAASHPIRPNSTYEGVHYDCACKPLSDEKESLQENLIYYDDLTGAFYIQHDPYLSPAYHRPYYSGYTHDYYWRYHYDQNTAAASLVILFALFLVPFLWYACLRPQKPASVIKKKKGRQYVHAVSTGYEGTTSISIEPLAEPQPIEKQLDIESGQGEEYQPSVYTNIPVAEEGEEEDNFHLSQF